MNSRQAQWLRRLPALFEIPAPDSGRVRSRIEFMERNVMLPVKAAFIAFIWYSFHYSPWIRQISSALDIAVDMVQGVFWFYLGANVIFAAILLVSRRLPLALVQWTVVTSSLVDGLIIAAMTLVTGGLDSGIFWLFLGLIIRNSVSVPPGFSQFVLNFLISLCYVLVGVLDISMLNNLDPTTLRALDVAPHDDLGQPFALRLMVLWLTGICCYGAQVLLERQRIAGEEAGEFAAREGQLRSAGRLAAEIAHQIKNPLAVINSAAFSLKRSFADGKSDAAQQIEIIQEEVARADRVITQIMGYAQLSEGRVEKLDVVEEFNLAIAQVFPPVVPTRIQIHRDYGRNFQPLLMQRAHLSEILVNLLKNAKESVGETGNIFVQADCRHDHFIKISVADDGPGVPPEMRERIFEAYFSTKENGSGLGLSIVKHNAELYGGKIRLESGLGKGAKFTVIFPAKTLMKFSTA
ncbi:MAG TPA: HAMP domain-containing sensor histidine kinase [Verrucomicrobiae bacterium]|nr:HAMP domain-containing sensor histidine kinase [Verrucomicrobiae bacterium]